MAVSEPGRPLFELPENHLSFEFLCDILKIIHNGKFQSTYRRDGDKFFITVTSNGNDRKCGWSFRKDQNAGAIGQGCCWAACNAGDISASEVQSSRGYTSLT